MKIHSYSTSPRHEEANTRTAKSNRKTAAAAVAKQPNGVETSRGDSSARRLQRPTRTVRNNTPVAARNRNPELDNKANRLAVATARRRTQLEKLKEHQRTSSANSAEEEEEEEEEAAEGELDPLDDEETDEVVEEEEEEEQAEQEQGSDAEASAAKRPRREVKEVVGTRTAKATPPQRGKQQQAGERQQKLVRIATEKQQTEEEEQEEEEEDDGTSSSTASAEEEIGEEMEPLGPKGGPRVVSTASRVSLGRGSSSAVARGSTTTILLAEEDYDEQDQQVDEEDAAMDEYEGASGAGALGGGSEDMEDTDGALTGNRLFRKKVKRKVHTRTNSTSAGSSLGGLGGATNQITSSKAKLQMLQEFPTLFIGLRRNRMFLVNSLAQSFDLNQRDIVLTLRKIKQNESSARLANFFGIGAAEVDLLFHTSVPKIADCLRNFIVWPDDFTMKLNVPISLRQHFNRIHLILNYLVLRVKQNAVQQLPPSEIGTAYCPVDQCHKLKYLVASTLDGCVCFVSRAFGVQTDDEQLLAQSGFLTKFKTNTNLIAGQNFHNFEDRLANGHDHTNNNGGGRNRRSRAAGGAIDDDDLERVLGGGGSCDDENFEDIVSEKISKSRTFKLKNYIENILENFQNHQMLSPHTCIDGRTFKLLDDIVVIVGALINLQKQEID
ncbi:serine/threonine-protein kinase pakA-like [Anopheles coustani]|nr:serine/threonine-protein kinase pakA-like [Anopheles coustani]XP_058119092.1 serine/threonine-protein kinase pakA-like [Anopheles coustani]XP_058119093.1 serine/threonine-protein kinase pakA-like [Anopheles coustani]XP_058119094.1 serine/threonine-protein kinase pakA-like [Anopheles coustani]XP_058119095.1 serine/threonine-protein kinase pakA-like [Anopheles coustani]XP_058119096.1 serine/threonine-protein kinase pakA-like [Anopheles coustani]XP_058119098.1 serine/threonine-protein kinase 